MNIIQDLEWPALWLTLKLAGTTTVVLLLLAIPLAWWLAGTRRWYKDLAASIITLPLILPPTVLGFYLLIAMAPDGFLGQLSSSLGGPRLAFSFEGLVIASVIYSLPFAVQPLLNSFRNLDPGLLEAAATLRANAWQRFSTVVLPLSRTGLLTAGILSFAHTIGEFGVILMIGGNIPGETRVVSIAIYDHVEAMHYAGAHALSLLLIIFALVVLMSLHLLHRNSGQQNRSMA